MPRRARHSYRWLRIVIGMLLAGVFATWFVANAGVGMKAPDIDERDLVEQRALASV